MWKKSSDRAVSNPGSDIDLWGKYSLDQLRSSENRVAIWKVNLIGIAQASGKGQQKKKRKISVHRTDFSCRSSGSLPHIFQTFSKSEKENVYGTSGRKVLLLISPKQMST